MRPSPSVQPAMPSSLLAGRSRRRDARPGDGAIPGAPREDWPLGLRAGAAPTSHSRVCPAEAFPRLAAADLELEAKIAITSGAIQVLMAGWPRSMRGSSNQCHRNALFRAEESGDSTEAPHRVRARTRSWPHGGARTVNVFNPRDARSLCWPNPLPACRLMAGGESMPAAPAWFPFHLDKIPLGPRTVLVPLLVLIGLERGRRNPRGIGIAALLRGPPERVRNWPKGPHQLQLGRAIFGRHDRVLRRSSRSSGEAAARRAIDACRRIRPSSVSTARMGLGAIFLHRQMPIP